MTQYHPDTDKEILRLHQQGTPPRDIATETGVPVAYVYKLATPEPTRQTILNHWHNGTGKREISARLNIPLTTIQAIIRADTPNYRRPPTRPDQQATLAQHSRADRLIAAGRTSTRENTRKLAERAAAILAKLRTTVEEERRQKRLAARVEQAARKLAEARAAAREKP